MGHAPDAAGAGAQRSRDTRDGAISVVVSSRDRADQLATALPAVLAALSQQDELIVVDSASADDGTRAIAEKLGVRLVREDRPGLSRARNAGIRAARMPIVAFTDDDCRPDRGWLDALRAEFDDASVGFVTGPTLADREGRTASVLEHGGRRRFAGKQDAEGIGHGANMTFRRDVLVSLGGFDELLGTGALLGSGEDSDMLYRTLEAGWTGVYTPAATVTHSQWRSFRQLLRVRYRYGMGNAAWRGKTLRRDRATGIDLLRHLLVRNAQYTVWSLVKFQGAHVMRSLSYDAGVLVGVLRARALPVDGALFRDGRATAGLDARRAH